jgi:DNA-directed RNA polymerase specialized sigma24 family protein
MKRHIAARNSRFDSLVARYYPAVYSFAAQLTDDPRDAIALTRKAFVTAHKRLRNLRDHSAVVATLLTSVLRARLANV